MNRSAKRISASAVIWGAAPFALAVMMTGLLALPAQAQIKHSRAAQSRRKSSETKPSPAVERGQKTFERNCAFCHGQDATGGRGPDLVRSPLVADDKAGDRIGPVILNGRPSKGMPALHLSGAEIKDIAEFMHYRQAEGVASARLPANYALKWMLTGNAAAGKEFFNGAGKCKDCHSPAGDLAHVATKYTPLDLEAKMLYPNGKDSRTVTVTLPSGQTIEGPLDHLDEFTVALHDSAGWYRSFSRDQVKVSVHDPLAAHRELLDTLSQADMHNLFAYLETLK
ncbi:MAG TPA: c-type cytochrome [Terriglobia bacterium]|nr:c-type cytochrome [Terriglobia bacterium]